MKEFITEYEDVEAEVAGVPVEERFVEFKVDGRELRAYWPTEGQLVFMMAALGRGQSGDQRLAAIVNIMLSCMRGEDADYLEGRLLTRDQKNRLPVKQVEAIFEHLAEEWFRSEVSSGGATVRPGSGQVE